MSTLRIEILDSVKLPLVTRLYKQHYPSAKAKKDELVIVGYAEQNMVSVVRFRTIEHYRLLTGMLVVPELRDKGLAHQLMAYCQEHVLADRDFCFAYQHLEGFYTQHGFNAVEGTALPNSLKQLFQRYCASGKKLVAMQYIP